MAPNFKELKVACVKAVFNITYDRTDIPLKTAAILFFKPSQKSEFPDVNFQVWDFAGQREFYVTHKVFLTPLGLYLLLFDLRTFTEGVMALRPWLLDIQVTCGDKHTAI